MEMMSAARLHNVAEPFRIDTVPLPEATGSDVLIRVHACGVVPNLKNVAYKFPEWFPYLPLPPLPGIFGLDPAGEIVAVGPQVAGLSPGQRVYVNPVRTCGGCVKCRRGDLASCSSYTFAGYFGFGPGSAQIFERYPWGGFAQYMAAPASSLVVLPDEVSYEEAARFGYLGTSYGALRKAEAGPETTVLVNGATGTLGVGAVLLALAMGVPKILAVARNEQVLAEIKALAPDRIETFALQNGACTEWARAVTDGYGPDVVIEALGPGAPTEVTLAAMNAVSRGGKIVTIGGREAALPLDPIWLMVNQITYYGSLWFTTAEGDDMARMAKARTLDLSKLHHVRFPLDRVNEALSAAEHRDHGGFSSVVVLP